MPRAVQTLQSSLIHLFVEGGSKTQCGLFPARNAPDVIHRDLMCMNCFGHDHGFKEYNASRLGLTKIWEHKPGVTTITSRANQSTAARKPVITLPKINF